MSKCKMIQFKNGDLVKWKNFNDIGIVVDFNETDSYYWIWFLKTAPILPRSVYVKNYFYEELEKIS